MVGASQRDERVEELEARVRELEGELSVLKLKGVNKDRGNGRAMWRAPPRPKNSNRNTWKGGVVFVLIYTSIFASIAYWNYYSEKHSTRSLVIATVDEWRLLSGGGNGGGIGNYLIKITLPDGSKDSARALPIDPKPPAPGQRIQLVKIISGFGFTSYVWER